MRNRPHAAAHALVALFTPDADPETRHDGGLLFAAFCEDIAALRSVLVKRK